MKFMKKAAALFFCLALAFSVMAVTALADEPNSVDPGYKVTLSETTTATKGANVNKETDGANEYETGSTISYDIYLEIQDGSVHVNSFQFDVNIGSGSATLTTTNVTAINDFSVAEAEDAQYAFATNGVAGVAIGVTPVQIGSISFSLSSTTPGAKQTFQLQNFNVYATEKTDSFNANVDETAKTVEVDPQYTITFKQPVTSSNVITYSGSPAVPSYTETVSGTAPTYKILYGGTVSPPVLNNYYTFDKYIVAASVGSWVKDTEYTEAELNSLLGAKTMYGNVTLNLKYKANVYDITVSVPNVNESNGTLSFKSDTPTPYTEYENQAYTSTTIKYTIEGKADGDRSADATAITAPEAKTAYTFVNYAVSSSDTNWANTGDNLPGPGASIAVASLP